MKPITLEIDNVQVTLKNIHQNKVYQCHCENPSANCSLKQQLSINPSLEHLIATEAIFNVRNVSDERWPIQVMNWDLVNTDGYAYKARVLCDALRPARTIEPALSIRDTQVSSYVTPGTQVDFVLAFPELEKGKEIACILFSEKGMMLHAFEIKKTRPEAADLLQAREAARAKMPSLEADLRRFRFHFQKLERKIYFRLTKTIVRAKEVELENEIKELVFDIKRELESETERTRNAVGEKLTSILNPYESKLTELKVLEEERRKLDQKVEQLSKLSGDEFEEWFEDLLIELGYEKVTRTPSSNDEGIDILAESKGSKVAIQCKNWKAKVGRPEVQSFLGAIQHAEIQRGLLVTTGLFTTGAEKMASEHQIDLIDGTRLTDLIQKAQQK